MGAPGGLDMRSFIINAGLVFAVASGLLVYPTLAQELSDEEVRQRIIQSDIAAYPGNCSCPYNRASNGSRCGKRSAWSKAGGYAPRCYPQDVSDSAVKSYRDRMR